MHKGGFAAARVLKPGIPGVEGCDAMPEGKCKVKLEHGGEILEVDEEDVEKVRMEMFPNSIYGYKLVYGIHHTYFVLILE